MNPLHLKSFFAYENCKLATSVTGFKAAYDKDMGKLNFRNYSDVIGFILLTVSYDCCQQLLNIGIMLSYLYVSANYWNQT